MYLYIEPHWSSGAMQAMNSVLQKCVQNNINVFVSSGDNGSSDSINDGLAHVDFPGSSPWVISCGGTTLQANLQTNPPTIISETVWNNNPTSSATVITNQEDMKGISSHLLEKEK